MVEAAWELLMAGQIDAAVAGLNAVADSDPKVASTLWQRGIALYYSGQFAEASLQFKRDIPGNPNDVEEVVWACCADARLIGIDAARAQFAACGVDPRPPMAEILSMFKETGRDGIGAVIAKGDDLGADVSAYAAFYVGLFLEAICGDRAEAMQYFKRAADRPPDDNMAAVFQLHHQLSSAAHETVVPRSNLGASNTHSKVILGGWQLSAGHHDHFNADAALFSMAEHAREGITTLDCGDIYTGVEELLGRHVQRCRAAAALRPQIHTKLVPDLGTLQAVDASYCEAVLLRSKNRLRLLEPLDLVQFHWWDWHVGDHIKVYRYLCDLKMKGLVRETALTNYDGAHLQELLDAGLPVAANQVQYSLIDRRAEYDLGQVCVDAGVKLLCYGVLAGGFLTDTWLGKPEPAHDAALENRSLVKYRLMIDKFGGWDRFQKLLELCRQIADAHGPEVTVANVAVAWVLSRPAVGGVILGARNARHLPSTKRASRLVLAGDECDMLEKFLGPAPEEPFFAIERIQDGPHGRIMRTELNQVFSQTHLNELESRVDFHLSPEGKQAWSSDYRKYTEQLLSEAQTFGTGTSRPAAARMSEKDVARLDRLRQRLREAL